MKVCKQRGQLNNICNFATRKTIGDGTWEFNRSENENFRLSVPAAPILDGESG